MRWRSRGRLKPAVPWWRSSTRSIPCIRASVLLPYIAELAARHAFVEVVPVSALNAADMQRLQQVIARQLPVSVPLFPPEQLTDRSQQFRIAEIIREKLTLELNEELPYGVAVEVEAMGEG